MSVNQCVMCGAMIPEGRQVCGLCERRVLRGAGTHKDGFAEKVQKRQSIYRNCMVFEPHAAKVLSESAKPFKWFAKNCGLFEYGWFANFKTNADMVLNLAVREEKSDREIAEFMGCPEKFVGVLRDAMKKKHVVLSKSDAEGYDAFEGKQGEDITVWEFYKECLEECKQRADRMCAVLNEDEETDGIERLIKAMTEEDWEE